MGQERRRSMLIIYALQVDNELHTALLTALDIYNTTGMEPCEMFCSFASYEFNPTDAQRAISSESALEEYRSKYTLPLEPEKPHDIVAELYAEIKTSFHELCRIRNIATLEAQKEFYKGFKELTMDNPAKIKQIIDGLLQVERPGKT